MAITAMLKKSCTRNALCLTALLVALVSAHYTVAEQDIEYFDDVIFCKTYENVETAQMDAEDSPSVRSAIKVFDKFDVTSVNVAFNLTHSRMGALNVALQAIEPRSRNDNSPDWSPLMRSSVLMARVGRKQKVLTNIEFTDDATEMYGQEAAEELPPSSGSFKPKSPLADVAYGQSEFAGLGGSKGWWRLVVRDVADNLTPRSGTLSGWTLELCGREMPEMPSENFIIDTIGGLPEGSVPKSSENVNPSNSTAPVAIIVEELPISEETMIQVPIDLSDISPENENMPLENTFADDRPISNPNNGVMFMPIWEYARAWTERIAIRLGRRY